MRLIKLAGVSLPALLCVCLAEGQVMSAADPLRKADSIRSSLQTQVKEKVAGLGRQLLPGDTAILKSAIQSGKQQLGNFWGEAKMPLLESFSKVKIFSGGKVIRMNGVEVQADYSYLNDSTGVALGAFQDLRGIYNYKVRAGVTLLDMPFQAVFQGQNGIYNLQHNPFDQLSKFNFDHKQYLEIIRKKVAEKLNPEMVTAAITNRINTLRNNYEAKLRKEIESMKGEFEAQYKSTLQLPDGITDLSKTDMSALKAKLMSKAGVGNYEASAEKLQEMLKKGALSLEDTALLKDVANIQQRETMEKIFQKIVSAREGFENNKIVKELKGHLPFTPDSYKDFLKNPGNLSKLLEDYIDMSTLQRIFTNVTQLDIGQNPVQGGDFGLQNLINTGINTTFKNRKTSVGVMYGKNNNINQWTQAGLNSAISNEYSSMAGFSIGSGTGSQIEKSISLNFFNFNSSPTANTRDGMLQAAYLGVPPRKDATITLHTGYTVGGNHKISVDVSKSFGAFNDQQTADSIQYKMNAHSELLSGNGSSNWAAMLDYTGELLETDVRLFVKKVGLGYNNPGNSLLRRGETQVGAGFARKWLGNKLTTRYHLDFRKQNFDPLKRYTHATLNNKVQVNYKIRRNNRIGLTYQRSDYNSQLFAAASSKGGNERLQADGAYEFKIARKKLINNVAVSYQAMDIPMLAGQQYKGNSVMFMHTSTILVKQSPLSVQLVLNRSDNKDYLFNTSMFTLETNYSYPVASGIRFGSGLGYYTNAGWNRQVGGRQQLSAVVLGNLNLDVEVSYRKAVYIERPELANQLFITAGARYNF